MTYPRSRHHPTPFLDPPPSLTHFRAWKAHRPYNLCGEILALSRWSPYRSATTCPLCLQLLDPKCPTQR